TPAAPDATCPICLDTLDDIAYVKPCFHKFCFGCVLRWSKTKAECPLCKQVFQSILHTVLAEDDYQEYVVRPPKDSSGARRPRQRAPRHPATRRHRRPAAHPQQQSPAPQMPSSAQDGSSLEGPPSHSRQRQRAGGLREPSQRLSLHRQASAESRPQRHVPATEEEMLNFRRALYRTGMRVQRVPHGGHPQDISAEFFSRNPDSIQRLLPWLQRELRVLFGVHQSLITITELIVLTNLRRYDLDSQAFADDLELLLLSRTRHFVHKLISFAQCSCTMGTYDRQAIYDCHSHSQHEGGPSASLSLAAAAGTATTPGPAQSPSPAGSPGYTMLPVTSYAGPRDIATATQSPQDLQTNSDNRAAQAGGEAQRQLPAPANPQDSDSSSDSCVLVGCWKPSAERSPECIVLSSDSEHSAPAEEACIASPTSRTVKSKVLLRCVNKRPWADRMRLERPCRMSPYFPLPATFLRIPHHKFHGQQVLEPLESPVDLKADKA
ncbi:E3 ubiquitin-protein ligase Topors-like, partial [Rhea pennata]|uniref:E3 ubiquitin-protein ligase Topors-like n=1 Tax=Rhea pennata TaxID=8795 RepID=UPI002E255F2E